LLVAAERGEDKSKIVEYFGGWRRPLQQRADKPKCFDIATLLVSHQSKKMQRVEMSGLGGEKRAADLFGVVAAALPVQRQRLLNFIERRRLGRRPPRRHRGLIGRHARSVNS
jgi:hypothetical protein